MKILLVMVFAICAFAAPARAQSTDAAVIMDWFERYCLARADGEAFPLMNMGEILARIEEDGLEQASQADTDDSFWNPFLPHDRIGFYLRDHGTEAILLLGVSGHIWNDVNILKPPREELPSGRFVEPPLEPGIEPKISIPFEGQNYVRPAGTLIGLVGFKDCNIYGHMDDADTARQLKGYLEDTSLFGKPLRSVQSPFRGVSYAPYALRNDFSPSYPILSYTPLDSINKDIYRGLDKVSLHHDHDHSVYSLNFGKNVLLDDAPSTYEIPTGSEP